MLLRVEKSMFLLDEIVKVPSLESLSRGDVPTNSTTNVRWTGLVGSSTWVRVAYVPFLGSCGVSADRLNVVTVPDAVVDPMINTTLASAGVYKTCMSIDGGSSWQEQAATSKLIYFGFLYGLISRNSSYAI
jgi:hypothetical protein